MLTRNKLNSSRESSLQANFETEKGMRSQQNLTSHELSDNIFCPKSVVSYENLHTRQQNLKQSFVAGEDDQYQSRKRSKIDLVGKSNSDLSEQPEAVSTDPLVPLLYRPLTLTNFNFPLISSSRRKTHSDREVSKMVSFHITEQR